LMLKTTSLVSILALADLLYSAQSIYTRTFQTIPLLIVVSLWYITITSILTVGQTMLERKLSGGRPRQGTTPMVGWLLGGLVRGRPQRTPVHPAEEKADG